MSNRTLEVAVEATFSNHRLRTEWGPGWRLRDRPHRFTVSLLGEGMPAVTQSRHADATPPI